MIPCYLSNEHMMKTGILVAYVWGGHLESTMVNIVLDVDWLKIMACNSINCNSCVLPLNSDSAFWWDFTTETII